MPILPNNSNFFRCFYNIYTNQKFLNKNMLTVYTVLYLHVFFFHFKLSACHTSAVLLSSCTYEFTITFFHQFLTDRHLSWPR